MRSCVLPVGRDGIVDLDAARAAIDGRTALVAAMLVNNEIGTIQPIAELGALAREAGAAMLCDAVQGFGRVPLPVEACDMVAISAHKIHGPKGIGALWLRDGVAPAPLLHGGGQEGGLRSGTLAPALCVGFGAAAALAFDRVADDAAHVERIVARGAGRLRRGLVAQRLGDAALARQSQRAARRARRRPADGGPARHRLLGGLGLRQRIGAAEPCAARDRARQCPGARLDPARFRPLHDGGRDRRGRRRDPRGRRAPGGVGGMTRVRFLDAAGTLSAEVDAAAGARLLDVAQAAGQPLEGTCEGQMACSTCHVVVAPEDFARLPPASDNEEDLLDLAAHVTRTSRLACQIWLDEGLADLTVRMPGAAHNMTGR